MLRLVDARPHTRWSLDNNLIDQGWIKRIGLEAWAVYCVIVREVEGGEEFPSLSYMHTVTGIEKEKLQVALKVLRDRGLIEVEGDGDEKVCRVVPPKKPGTSLTLPEIEALFAEAWQSYPKRPNNPKQAALKSFAARIREGVDPQVLIAGVKSYAKYVEAEGTEPHYIKMAQTFFGPGGHWEADYTPTDTGVKATAGKALLDFYKQETLA